MDKGWSEGIEDGVRRFSGQGNCGVEGIEEVEVGPRLLDTVYYKMFTTNSFHEFHEWSKFAKLSITNFICICEQI